MPCKLFIITIIKDLQSIWSMSYLLPHTSLSLFFVFTIEPHCFAASSKQLCNFLRTFSISANYFSRNLIHLTTQFFMQPSLLTNTLPPALSWEKKGCIHRVLILPHQGCSCSPLPECSPFIDKREQNWLPFSFTGGSIKNIIQAGSYPISWMFTCLPTFWPMSGKGTEIIAICSAPHIEIYSPGQIICGLYSPAYYFCNNKQQRLLPHYLYNRFGKWK